MASRVFIVQITVPPGVSQARMREYIKDSVQSNTGMLPPEDPLFHMDREMVVVRGGFIGQAYPNAKNLGRLEAKQMNEPELRKAFVPDKDKDKETYGG